MKACANSVPSLRVETLRAHRMHAVDAGPEEAGDEAERQPQEQRVGDPQRGDRAEPRVDQPVEQGGDRLREGALGRAVEGRGADREQHQRHGARRRDPSGRTRKRSPAAERPVTHLERRQAREHAEVDGEGLAALEPALAAEERHADERVGRVGEGGNRDRVRGEAHGLKAGGTVDELEPDEGKDAGGCGPAPETLGIAPAEAAPTVRPRAGTRPRRPGRSPARD